MSEFTVASNLFDICFDFIRLFVRLLVVCVCNFVFFSVPCLYNWFDGFDLRRWMMNRIGKCHDGQISLSIEQFNYPLEFNGSWANSRGFIVRSHWNVPCGFYCPSGFGFFFFFGIERVYFKYCNYCRIFILCRLPIYFSIHSVSILQLFSYYWNSPILLKSTTINPH